MKPHFTIDRLIEYCFDCQTHQWCTRHKSEMYLDYATKMQSAIEAKLGAGSVLMNKFDTRLCEDQTIELDGKTLQYSATPHMGVLYDRCLSFEGDVGTIGNFLMGAFEVYYMGVRIYSKKQSNIWPSIPMVVEKCLNAHADFVKGEDISVYETFAGLKQNELNDMLSMTQ